MRKIVVDWSYPIEIGRILSDVRMSDIGLYYITSTFEGQISDLYIGKTIHSYKSRLASHYWDWLDNYPGKKYVRLGTIIKPSSMAEDDFRQLINSTETTLIFCCSEQLIHNKMCKKSCNPSQRLHIFNTGRRGNLPSEVYISDEEWQELTVEEENMFEKYDIKQIRLLPMGQDDSMGFSTEEGVREFLENELSEDGIYYYGQKGLNIYDQDALILFQYDGSIVGYGIFMTRNDDERYYQFYPESIHNVDRVSSVEFRAVNPGFTRFGQGMSFISLDLLEPISVLLKIKQAVFDAG